MTIKNSKNKIFLKNLSSFLNDECLTLNGSPNINIYNMGVGVVGPGRDL